MTRNFRVVAVAATAVTTTLLVSACNPAQAGSAATVGDVRVTESQVNQAAAEALAAAATDAEAASTGLDTASFLRQNTNRLIDSQLLAIAAREEAITVTPSEIEAVIAQASGGVPPEQFEAQLAAQFAVPPSDLDDFVRDFLLHQKLGVKLDPGGEVSAQSAAADARLVQVADQVGVTVSPRYGKWDAASASIDSDLNDLSSPPAPSPSHSRPATIQ